MPATYRNWHSSAVGAAFVAGTCALCAWLLAREFAQLASPALRTAQLAQTRATAQLLSRFWDTPDDDLVRQSLYTLRGAGIEFVISDGNGEVRIDGRVEGRRDPPAISELRDVLRSGSAVDVRPWMPGGAPFLVTAVRVEKGGVGVGVVWLARPIEPLVGNPEVVWRLSLATVGLAAVATLVFVLIVEQMRRRALTRIIDAARNISEGDLAIATTPDTPSEVSALAGALRTLRDRLATQVGVIDRQRRMLEALVDQLREGVVVARGDGRVALINPAAVRMLGLQVAEGGEDSLVGRTVEASIPQHALQRLLSGPLLPAERVVADEARDTENRATPIEVQTRRGVIHLLARASDVVLAEPGLGASGGALGRVVVMTDITELQRTIQMRTDFVANASHELRTPLSTIRAAVETLLAMDLATEGPAARQFLAKIDRHSLRLEQMVSDLLDLSRLESPTARFNPEPIDARRTLNELHGRYAEALERKNLEWETRVEPPSVTVIVVNPQLARLVLDNLVDNAIKFTEPGGQITVALRRAGEMAELEVSDTGCGIPPEEQERVFERFYQVQRARTGGADRGTGLGLSIVRHAVSAMGATIRLQSAPGKGTTVTVVVPQQPDLRP